MYSWPTAEARWAINQLRLCGPRRTVPLQGAPGAGQRPHMEHNLCAGRPRIHPRGRWPREAPQLAPFFVAPGLRRRGQPVNPTPHPSIGATFLWANRGPGYPPRRPRRDGSPRAPTGPPFPAWRRGVRFWVARASLGGVNGYSGSTWAEARLGSGVTLARWRVTS